MKIGINGFGRIGRAIFRLISKIKDINVVAINDINKDIKNVCLHFNMIVFMENFNKVLIVKKKKFL